MRNQNHCETVSEVLGLYAEGELHDPRAVQQVREHLFDCVECREVLDAYDSLTRVLLAGEPGRLSEGADRWIDADDQRRLERVLRRLDCVASPSAAATGESVAGGSPAPDGLTSRPTPPRLRLHLDDTACGRPAGRRLFRRTADGAFPPRSPRGDGLRSSGLAAAALLGALSVWLAVTFYRNAPEPDGQALLDHSDRPARVLVASSGPGAHASQWSPGENDRDALWVRDRAEAGTGGSEPELLYRVGYPERARSLRDHLTPAHEAEIEWAVEVVVSHTPEDGGNLSKPRYLLVPEVGGSLAGGARSRPAAGALWIQPVRVERRPARRGPAARLLIVNSIFYRVYVYEAIRQLELPDDGWPAVPWQPAPFGTAPSHTPFGTAPSHGVPRPLPAFTGSPLGQEVRPEPLLRF